jgi:hypothetical protein
MNIYSHGQLECYGVVFGPEENLEAIRKLWNSETSESLKKIVAIEWPLLYRLLDRISNAEG